MERKTNPTGADMHGTCASRDALWYIYQRCPCQQSRPQLAISGLNRLLNSLQIAEFREPRKNRNQNASGLDLWGMKQKHARSYGRYVWLQLELFQ
jgi:hypothetical protein